ncbi:cysteine hydrolase family protein [Streptomyces sp. GQFP]|uniref:cysteine hydrolase family protein n=1 Tax=Streptomyces sp. GQFP TaxID=2907545 RepID=UPI001F280395|nr:isochorismatase family cysteine hydrolase [Streptomyces sp. GQFP]UIX33215.1 cysteine hydrolase [Streptomyces sp. GQFP]
MATPTTPGTPGTAFLALDYVTYIVDNFSHDPSVADRAANALAAARTAGLPVFHVVPQGMQEQVHPLLAPAEGETVLTKTGFSAFASTDLRERLEAAGVGRIVVAGVATSGTVLSTTRWAVDTGLKVTVVADACDDPDPQVNALLLDESVAPKSWVGLWRVADVLSAAEIPELRP